MRRRADGRNEPKLLNNERVTVGLFKGKNAMEGGRRNRTKEGEVWLKDEQRGFYRDGRGGVTNPGWEKEKERT